MKMRDVFGLGILCILANMEANLALSTYAEPCQFHAF